MKKAVVSSNMHNEIDQLPEWFDFVEQIADGGILIVDSGSTDGTQKYAESRGAIVINSKIIQSEGYGPARNELRELSKKHFPDSHWMIYLDADERIDSCDFHIFRSVKDYLDSKYDCIAFPRIDWVDKEKTKAAKDYHTNPDWQARMTRLDSPIKYVRKLHEQITGVNAIFTALFLPKINHFHRSASKNKRDQIGKLCAKLHMEDTEHGDTYPIHHKEMEYRKMYEKEGL